MEKWERISENAKKNWYEKNEKKPVTGFLLSVFIGCFGISYSKPFLGIIMGFVQTFLLVDVIKIYLYLSKSDILPDECVNKAIIVAILWVSSLILSPFFCKLHNENLKQKIWRI